MCCVREGNRGKATPRDSGSEDVYSVQGRLGEEKIVSLLQIKKLQPAEGADEYRSPMGINLWHPDEGGFLGYKKGIQFPHR